MNQSQYMLITGKTKAMSDLLGKRVSKSERNAGRVFRESYNRIVVKNVIQKGFHKCAFCEEIIQNHLTYCNKKCRITDMVQKKLLPKYMLEEIQ